MKGCSCQGNPFLAFRIWRLYSTMGIYCNLTWVRPAKACRKLSSLVAEEGSVGGAGSDRQVAERAAHVASQADPRQVNGMSRGGQTQIFSPSAMHFFWRKKTVANKSACTQKVDMLQNCFSCFFFYHVIFRVKKMNFSNFSVWNEGRWQ